MAVRTFENVWRSVLLHCPLASPFLARLWVQNAYNKLSDTSRWSYLRAEGEFLTNDSKGGSVSVTRGSTLITGIGLTFLSTDVDRQFKTIQGPPYTIDSVNVGANTATLDRVYGPPTSASIDAMVLDAYITMPEDFGSFIVVLDPVRSWKLRIWVTENELNRWDSARTTTGNPWALASRRLASTTNQDGRIQYELWPYTTTAARYPYYYIRRPEELSDSDEFFGPLRARTDIILKAALIECAQWPGLADKKNPYFSPTLAISLQKQLDLMMEDINARDQEIYLTWLDTSGLLHQGFAPMDAKYMQTHGPEAYWGMNGYYA